MIVWLIGGLDPSGGAGLVRDARAALGFAPGAQVACALTAFTIQGDGLPARAFPVDRDRLATRLRDLPPPEAIKIGLVPAPLAEVLIEHVPEGVAIVLDPVLRASDGGDLGADADSVRRLMTRAVVCTPNTDEAVAIFGDAPERTLAVPDRRRCWVLIKGGHRPVAAAVEDRLFSPDGDRHDFVRPRQAGPDVRGTGCALATAIACGLAHGASVAAACARAIAWLDAERAHARPGPDGRLHLP